MTRLERFVSWVVSRVEGRRLRRVRTMLLAELLPAEFPFEVAEAAVVELELEAADPASVRAALQLLAERSIEVKDRMVRSMVDESLNVDESFELGTWRLDDLVVDPKAWTASFTLLLRGPGKDPRTGALLHERGYVEHEGVLVTLRWSRACGFECQPSD